MYITILYTYSLYSIVYQLYFNKNNKLRNISMEISYVTTTLGKLLIFLLLLLSWEHIVLLMQRWWHWPPVSRMCGLAYLSSRSDRLVLISPYLFSHCQCEVHFQVNWVELRISSVTADQIPLFWLFSLKEIEQWVPN